MFMSPVTKAQDFIPPRPPPLDPAMDFDDMEEDMMEMGDEVTDLRRRHLRPLA